MGAKSGSQEAIESGHSVLLYFMPDEDYASVEYELPDVTEDFVPLSEHAHRDRSNINVIIKYRAFFIFRTSQNSEYTTPYSAMAKVLLNLLKHLFFSSKVMKLLGFHRTTQPSVDFPWRCRDFNGNGDVR